MTFFAIMFVIILFKKNGSVFLETNDTASSTVNSTPVSHTSTTSTEASASPGETAATEENVENSRTQTDDGAMSATTAESSSNNGTKRFLVYCKSEARVAARYFHYDLD